MTRSACLAFLTLSACTQIFNPCPEGSEPDPENQLCLRALNHDDGSVQGDDGSMTPSSLDAGGDGSPGLDGAPSDVEVSDGATHDDGGPDSAIEAGVCSQHDIDAWRGFHVGGDAVSLMFRCMAETCPGEICYPETCVRNALGLEACNECIDQESACVLEFCNSACDGSKGQKDDAECRACTCEAGCVARFEACAQVPLNVCTNVHGQDAQESDFQIEGPWLLRMKGATGWLQIGSLSSYVGIVPGADPATPQLPPWNASYTSLHMSEGFTHAVPFRANGRSYLLQHKSRCGNDPCIARVSPVLSKGQLGRPVYTDTWSRGWDEIEVFALGGKPHLLRYKSGTAPVQGEGLGHLRIDRMEFSEDLASLTLVSLLDQENSPITALTWSAFQSFELSGQTYLFRYGSARGGEVLVQRVEAQGAGLSLTAVTQGRNWSRGWDVLETFNHQGQPYLIAYKSGRIPFDGEPASTAKVYKLVASTETSLALVPVFEGWWEPGISHILPFQYNGTSRLLSFTPSVATSTTSEKVTSYLSLRSLSASPAEWGNDLSHVTWEASWVGSSAWDIMEIVQGSEPASP